MSKPVNLDAIRECVALLTEACPDSSWDEDWLMLAGRQLREAVDELERLRNAAAALLAKDALIEHYRDTGDEARAEVERLFFVATDALKRENAAKSGREALAYQRDEALAHVADARRVIEAVLRLCDKWEGIWSGPGDSDAAYDLREVMAAAGSGTRPTGDCGCGRHNSTHAHCYAGCDLSGCRMLGGPEETRWVPE